VRGTNFIEAVVERDIDLLLLEEMHVSTSFRSWLIKLVYGTDTEIASFEGAWHSFNHPVFHELVYNFLFRFRPFNLSRTPDQRSN